MALDSSLEQEPKGFPVQKENQAKEDLQAKKTYRPSGRYLRSADLHPKTVRSQR